MNETRMGRPQRCDLSDAPEEVAGRLRHLPGFVFLDSSSDQSGAVSLITALPERLLTGHLSESEPLREALTGMAANGGAGCDWGLPLGGLFGAVDFDGSYVFGAYRHAMVFHHDTGEWDELGEVLGEELGRGLASRGTEAIGDEGRVGVGGRGREMAAGEHAGGVDFFPEMGKGEFCARVKAAQEYIAAGDIYQVNLAHRFRARWEAGADGFGFYRRLRERSPAPMGAFMDLGGRQVLSASPESFLKMSGRWVRTRPIKGTRPRYADGARDALSAMELQRSEKEAAELVMITDLERNDLGQVCEFGSISVPEMLRLEAFEQVYHLVSTVEGTLREGIDHVEVLRQCFPGGSISGAPKKRALEVIAELESAPRGLYTGAVGYFGVNGESHFNIAIRTAVVEGAEMSFHVGAGIVADSDPEKEWEETLHKAAGILAAAGD